MISSALLAWTVLAADPGIVAFRVGRAETVAQGAIEHAVILVEDGKIVAVGQDLPIARGIPVIDRPEWVAMPGLVNCFSRVGLDSESAGGFEPQAKASGELFARQDVWQDVLDAGVTTLGLVPPGRGTAGQAVAVRPFGATPEEMIVRDGAFLLMELRTDPSSKKTFKQGFEKADDYAEKDKKAREKWDKEQEKKKEKDKDKKPKKEEEKKDGEGDKDKKDEEPKKEAAKEDVYTPPEVDPKVQPFLDLRAGTLSAVVRVARASDWLHLLDALGKEEVGFGLRLYLADDADMWLVGQAIGGRKVRVVTEPLITLRAHTRREVNIPDELADAGTPLAFVPRADTLPAFEAWRRHVGEVVAAGLDRALALRAMTLEPATVLGLEARLGSLEAGKDANIVFLDGDPLEPGTKVTAVMLEGRLVSGEVGP